MDIYTRLKRYGDTEFKLLVRPALFWPDGRSLGFGLAAHMGGIAQKFYKTFEYWGFRGLTEFYSLPLAKRNQFMDEAAGKWQELFGRDGEWIRDYCCTEIMVVVAPTTTITSSSGTSINDSEALAAAVVTWILDETRHKEEELRTEFAALAQKIKREAFEEYGWVAEVVAIEARKRFEQPFRDSSW